MQQFAQMGFPEIYERAIVGAVFRPWAEDMIEEAGITQGQRVIDVACGTGIVARLAHQRVGSTGAVAGVDVNPGMLAVARAVEPGIDWREGSAEALPVRADERFDVVTCQQGIQFFPDRAAAVSEMQRVLAPGGRLALSAWRPDEEMPFLRELRRIAEQRVGPINDRRHSFGDVGSLETLLVDAGFRDVQTRSVSRTIRFPDGVAFVYLNTMALVGMSEGAQDLDEHERQQVVAAVVDDSRDAIASNTDAEGLRYEIGANVATATA